MPLGELGDGMGARLTFCVYTLDCSTFLPMSLLCLLWGEITEIYLLFCGI